MYYKVLRKIGDEFYSAIVSESSNKSKDYALKYKMGGYTTPLLGKIMVFDNIGHAIQFAKIELSATRPDFHIFECYADNPKPASYVSELWSNTLVEFWKAYESGIEALPMLGDIKCAPNGTFFADKIRISPYSYMCKVESSY